MSKAAEIKVIAEEVVNVNADGKVIAEKVIDTRLPAPKLLF